MSASIIVLSFFAALLAALYSTPIVAHFAQKKNWVDVPRETRSMHHKKTPRAGGLAVIFAFFVGLGIQFFFVNNAPNLFETELLISRLAFPLGCVAIAMVGLYDDAYGLGFKKKFLFQGIIAYTMFLAGFRISVPEILWIEEDPDLQAALGLPLTLFWYIWVMNAVNLIDGLDGLASGVTLIAMVSLATAFGLNGDLSLLPVAVVLAGALVGFLFFNFNGASIFLGDTGSLFLGFLLATCSIEGSGHVHPLLAVVIPIIAIGFPLLDTNVAFMRRIFNGGSPFAPDKDHIHHRLTGRFGLSVKGAVVRLYIFNGLLGLAAIGLVVMEVKYTPFLIGGLCLLVGAWLKYLGYMNVKEGFNTIWTRMKTVSSRRIPRGEWASATNEEETHNGKEVTLDERVLSKKTASLPPEKLGRRGLIPHTIE